MRQLLGVDFTSVQGTTDNLEFRLGTVAYDLDGAAYIYCTAGGTIADRVAARFANTVSPYGAVVASGNAGRIDGVNATGQSVASGESFWLQVQGLCTNCNVATSTAAGTVLAMVSDANGDFAIINATPSTAGVHLARAICQEAESSGLADIRLL